MMLAMNQRANSVCPSALQASLRLYPLKEKSPVLKADSTSLAAN